MSKYKDKSKTKGKSGKPLKVGGDSHSIGYGDGITDDTWV